MNRNTIAIAVVGALSVTTIGFAGMPRSLPVPLEIIEPGWMEARKQRQLATAIDMKAFVDFSFHDQYEDSGITFSNICTDDTGLNYKPSHYDHGNGIAVADVDGDGLLDIYFTTQAGTNELWRNIGGGRFEDITVPAGVGISVPVGVSASFADIDNDGDPDLFATSVRGGNFLFENDGFGVFADITDQAGLSYEGHSSAAVFFDYDRDGLLDLFVCNVGIFTKDEVITASLDAVDPERGTTYNYFAAFGDAFAGHLKPERTESSVLYHNDGDNRFTDVTHQMALVDTGWSGAATPIDVNEDGWIDLYTLDMQGQDEYYENQKGKRFVLKSREVFPKTPWGGMCAKVFDFDNDGDFDLFVSDMHSDMSDDVPPDREKRKANMKYPPDFLRDDGMSVYGNAFYRNDGGGVYTEISDSIGAENLWPWGFSVGDLNADGFDDVFLASSMNYPFRYGINTLLINDLGKGFSDAEFILGVEPRRDERTAKAWFYLNCDDGVNVSNEHCTNRIGEYVIWGSLGSRSSVFFDLDADGDLDIVTNEFNSEPMVLISNLADKRPVNYLSVKLEGTASNRSGIGSVVEISTGENKYRKRNDGQSGYLSQSDMPLYFGLGENPTVDLITVSWPSGTKQSVDGPFVSGQVVTIVEK